VDSKKKRYSTRAITPSCLGDRKPKTSRRISGDSIAVKSFSAAGGTTESLRGVTSTPCHNKWVSGRRVKRVMVLYLSGRLGGARERIEELGREFLDKLE